MALENKIITKSDDFIDSMKAEGYAWNDIVNCLAHIMLIICKENIEDIKNIDKIVIENAEEVDVKIYVKE